jgi:hypothetical protein
MFSWHYVAASWTLHRSHTNRYGRKQQGREANHLPPFSAKDRGSYTLSALYGFLAWSVKIKDRTNFTSLAFNTEFFI